MSINSGSSGGDPNNFTLPQSFNVTDIMHKLHVTNYLTPTYCDYCSQLLIGLMKQGLKCESEWDLFPIS